MQQELKLIGAINGQRKDLPWEWVEMCNSPQQAAKLCIEKSNLFISQGDIAERLSTDRSHFNAMLNSKANRVRNMPIDLAEDLQDLMGNNAINQWQELYRKRLLRCQRNLEDKRAELLKTLADLDRQLEANHR